MTHEKTIAASIDYLVANYKDQPELDNLAARAGYDSAHFQKLFKTYVGISPKRLNQYMNMRHARGLLGEGANMFEAAHQTGLSGGGRLHDLFVTCEAATPGEVQKGGAGLKITYGFFAAPIGEMMIARTPRGLCWTGFQMDESRDEEVRRAKKHWPNADFIHDDTALEKDADQFMQIWRGQGDPKQKLKLDLYGTNFQLQVWQALLKIPCGETITYQDVARAIGRPKSSRAVGNAVGANPVSLLIPCHRVIRATGIIDNYGWGGPRKKLILAMENSGVILQSLRRT
ncbi:MAG: methylated-DNA--[protein]-cysteine S-methyltransferase [Alphaproteobacteria bacterium]